MLISMNQFTYDIRFASGGINRVEVAGVAAVVDARQVKCPGGVIEVESDGAVRVKAKRSYRRYLGSVLVDCKQPVTKDVDSEHPTDWIDGDANDRDALWNAEKATDYRRHDFVASIDARKEEVSVGKNREIVCTNRVKRVGRRVPSHTPPSLDLR
jgi:hypothetical protein